MPALNRLRLAAGATLLLFLLAATAPYLYLVEAFGYDDILREPPGAVLSAFAAGGPQLVWAWFAFATAALFFCLPAILLGRWLEAGAGANLGLWTPFAIASALLQAAGLSRWAFVVPGLAAAHGAAEPGSAGMAAIETAFSTLHQFAGVAIGEWLGQATLAIWTTGICLSMARLPGLWRAVAALGLVTVPLWIVAQGELLATAMPGLAAIEAAPFAFILWQVWLLATAVLLLAGAWRPSAAARSARA